MNINLSISKKAYKTKPSNYEISRMLFQSTTITLEVFAELIRSGYNFAHVYNTTASTFISSEKNIKNFKQSSTISIDVDNANKTLKDFVGSLTYVPTIAYTTPSNDNNTKVYRFRMVYVFNEPINDINQFKAIYNALEAQLNQDNGLTNKDSCGSNVAQYMNGSYGCDIINNFSKIYNKTDFNFVIPNNNDKKKSLYIILNDKNITNSKLPKNTKLSKKFINDLNTLEPFNFIMKYKAIYPIFESTPIEYNNGYALLSEDYLEIKRKWTWGSFETTNGLSKLYTITQKIKDGQGRRYHLGLAAMLRRKIKPDITLEQLIVNAVYDRLYYYDNTDGVLTNQVLIERCCYVMKLKEITIKSYNKKKFIVDKSFWAEQGINPKQASNIIRKQLNYENIGSWYDVSKSVKENLQFAKDNDIKTSSKTLYRFCKDNNLDTNPNKTSKEVCKNENFVIPTNNEKIINNNNINYNNNNTNTSYTMIEKDFLEKVDIIKNKLSNINNKDLLTTNYNKTIKWVTDKIYKYQLNVNKDSIISNITDVYNTTLNQLKENIDLSANKNEVLYRIQVSQYNSNDLFDLIKLLQSKIQSDFYVNNILVENNNDGYPWELIANSYNEYVITAA